MKNKNALIGYTGFIGSNLINFKKNIFKFNSKNIHEIKNQKFDILDYKDPLPVVGAIFDGIMSLF